MTEMLTVCVYSKETPAWCLWGPQGPRAAFEVVETHTQPQTETYTNPNSMLILTLTPNQFVSWWGLKGSPQKHYMYCPTENLWTSQVKTAAWTCAYEHIYYIYMDFARIHINLSKCSLWGKKYENMNAVLEANWKPGTKTSLVLLYLTVLVNQCK